MNGEAKITRSHRSRIAVVYVRQSTLAQVREHTESTARQYALAEQAVALGWAAADVEVIDADLGVSGPLRRGPRRVPRAGLAGSAWARSARSSGWRCPGWPAPRRTWPGCWSWPG